MSLDVGLPASSPGTFASATVDWTPDQFARWLLRGFSTWSDVRSHRRRERGFRPALFDPDRPPGLQVEDHVGLLAADMKAAFGQAILIALAHWTAHMPQIVMRELLRLAAGYKPVGAAPILYQLFIDGRFGAFREADVTRQRVFRTLCAFPTPEARRFLVTMRESRYWQRDLAAAFLRAQSAAGDGWIGWCRNVAADLRSLKRENEVDLAVTFRLIIQDVGGLASFVRSLPTLQPIEDAWIIDSLIKGEEAVLRFDPTVRNDWIVRCEGERVEASAVFAEKDAKAFDGWVKAVLPKASAQKLSELPRTYLRPAVRERKRAFLQLFAGRLVLQGAV